VASRDSPYGRVTVTELSGQIAVFENGALSYESEGTSAEEFVHLAALQRSTLESVLVLGGGAEGVVREILEHRPLTVDYVELNGLLLDLLLRYLPADLRGSLDAAPVRIVQADPRSYLRDSPCYDLILVGMPEPASGQSNRFYTREFFALCAERLKPGGVLAFRLRSAENLWTPRLLRRTASIHRALQDVFADVVVLPGVTNIVLAADVPLSRDPVLLAERFTARGIEARLVSPAYIDYLYTNDRFAETAALLAGAVAPVNSDVKPVCYQYTLLIWLANFFPVLAWLDLPELGLGTLARSPWAWLALAVAMVGLLLSRRSRSFRRVGLVAAAGFAGMVLETALILNYQTSSGVLYQNLGLLLTLFMAGLALGAGVLDRLDARGLPAGTGVALMADFVLLSLLSAWLLNSGWVGSLAATALLLLGCGFLVAAVFAYVSLRDRPEQRLVVSPLYAADLLGGCFGSLLASLLLIPVLGLAGSALAMALLLVLVFTLV
jgi:spermidine synthase